MGASELGRMPWEYRGRRRYGAPIYLQLKPPNTTFFSFRPGEWAGLLGSWAAGPDHTSIYFSHPLKLCISFWVDSSSDEKNFPSSLSV